MIYFKKILIPLSVCLVLLIGYHQLQNNYLAAQRPSSQETQILAHNTNLYDSLNVKRSSTPQRIHPVRIKSDFEFAGEGVPLHQLEVRERLDRELLVNTFWHSNTMLSYKLAMKYFETIEPILAKNNVPEDFKYLAVAESGLRHVVSPAGAAGFWQFLKGTAKEFNLEVNSYVDERYHLEKSSEAACKYILDAKEKFGTWTMAAASYNIGMSRLSSIIEKQKVDSYYDLHLNDETARYIFRIMAYKALFSNPEDFGYNFTQEDLYKNYDYKIIEVKSSIDDLAAFALENNTNYKLLKYMNPWLISTKLEVNPEKSYFIKIAIEQ